MNNHNLTPEVSFNELLVEKRPLIDNAGKEVDGLFNHWIYFNNPKQYNCYTTDALKEIILAFRQASNDRSAVAVVLTGVGDKAFCTGGNAKEYAEYYAGNPPEYKLYMRLFMDMITAILLCDKPVINRVNGIRLAGGQEAGMACDFSIAADTAIFGQAGPKHGSAPDGGSTDFLHLFVGINRAIESCTLCETWSAFESVRLGLVNKIVPVLRNKSGDFISSPFVHTEPVDDWGNPQFGRLKKGDDKAAARKIAEECKVDFTLLDREVDSLCYSLALTMPGCLGKTLESLRKKKLEHWYRNSETNRSWLALNMMTEARAGFRAFSEGPKNNRQVDFIKLRQRLANADPWNDDLVNDIVPKG